MRTLAAGAYALALGIVVALTITGPATAQNKSRSTIESATPSYDTSRIVAVGGDVTEIIYALGQDDKVIAVDATSQFPASALKDKTSVGYMRALSTEGVLSTSPTLVIASAGAGPKEVIKALKATSVPYVEIGQENSLSGAIAKIKRISSVLGVEAKGEKLVGDLKQDMAELATKQSKLKTRAKALFILLAQGGRAIVGGGGTSADEIMTLAGLDNVASGINGFKPIADEALIEMAPDTIIVMDRGDGSGTYNNVLKLPALAHTPAGKKKRVFVMDGLYLIGFGPRTAKAAAELMSKAYPAISADQPASLN